MTNSPCFALVVICRQAVLNLLNQYWIRLLTLSRSKDKRCFILNGKLWWSNFSCQGWNDESQHCARRDKRAICVPLLQLLSHIICRVPIVRLRGCRLAYLSVKRPVCLLVDHECIFSCVFGVWCLRPLLVSYQLALLIFSYANGFHIVGN